MLSIQAERRTKQKTKQKQNDDLLADAKKLARKAALPKEAKEKM